MDDSSLFFVFFLYKNQLLRWFLFISTILAICLPIVPWPLPQSSWESTGLNELDPELETRIPLCVSPRLPRNWVHLRAVNISVKTSDSELNRVQDFHRSLENQPLRLITPQIIKQGISYIYLHTIFTKSEITLFLA